MFCYSKKKSVTKSLKNAPERPPKCLSAVQPPKSLSPALFFHCFAQTQFQTHKFKHIFARESAGMATLNACTFSPFQIAKDPPVKSLQRWQDTTESAQRCLFFCTPPGRVGPPLGCLLYEAVRIWVGLCLFRAHRRGLGVANKRKFLTSIQLDI